MRRALVLAALTATVAGGGAAFAAGPGPNGHNDYGLCQAYFSGSQNGQDHKHQAPPFAALEDKASAANETVAEYCANVTPGGK